MAREVSLQQSKTTTMDELEGLHGQSVVYKSNEPDLPFSFCGWLVFGCVALRIAFVLLTSELVGLDDGLDTVTVKVQRLLYVQYCYF